MKGFVGITDINSLIISANFKIKTQWHWLNFYW